MILHKCDYQNSILYTIIDSSKRLVVYPTRYLALLRRRRRPDSTQEHTASVIKLFCQWLESVIPPGSLTVDEALAAVSGENIVDWINCQRETGVAENTIRNREVIVRQMFEYFTSEEVSLLKTIPWLKGYFTRRQHKKIPRFLTSAQVIDLLSQMPHESQRAAAHFMVDTGVRVSELIRLKRKHLPAAEDFSEKDNYLRLKVPGSKAFDGSKFKIRDTIMTRPVFERIRRYHASDEYRRAARWRAADPEKPVFLNTKSEELSYSSIYKTIKRAWKRSAGNSSAQEADVSTHWLRHTTAYSVLRSELGETWQDRLLILKGMLGHNSIRTTEIYCSIPLVVMHSINRPDERPRFEEAAEIYRSTYLPPTQSRSPEWF